MSLFVVFLVASLVERSKELQISRRVCTLENDQITAHRLQIFREVKLLNPNAKITQDLRKSDELLVVGPTPLCPR